MAKPIDTLNEITQGYDVILSDVWGVLHNGIDAFPAAGEALSQARADGVSVVLITNASRPSDRVKIMLDQIGVPETAYDAIVSSGDVTRKLIEKAPRRAFLIGQSQDLSLFQGLDVELVPADEADAIICTGLFNDEEEQPEDYRGMLDGLNQRGLPMIVANPDLIVERGHRLVPCAGALAAIYAEMGGETRYAGKPHSPIYEAALAKAQEIRGNAIDRSRIIAIGDGMPTDVKGALSFGLDLLYISGGIHAAEYTKGGKTDETMLNAYLEREAATPKWWMPRLA
ncbi:TIGR01459 family HAD-type hydrolase [Agrobacterium vitis]|uniref:TIGR01459 family HAD-type hydrolase n=1 Tax=Agrobacterium vitis TaxID=373 RepID=A0AAE4WFG5_AGRVI|nr:TIGR01459 family HAD-type hydrolase [Agrobacterium vitis]MCF1500170.1 TIGR01459 family HAD-type hydrolase [Allorhizobium sp. Av2]MCM2441768.1 TIGR01459 family HAD-type hydrolase [Agrobacterium vitis]MUZ59015.1 TIGR01459 family HAD-type hydrolase [Agrobacterium vitis]MVA68631.1 TIGR01459 family HAD-type hydrolase [Agrobacterium vitis]MVA88617.1 TIGR01459 family HAD-type hydrolase [Agrobacterium vitis]